MARLYILLFLFSVGISAIAAKLSIAEGQNVFTGQNLRLSAEGKKGLVIVFLSARCPSSQSHLAEIKELAGEFKEFQFVGVNSNLDESMLDAKLYFQKESIEFPVIKDTETQLADLYRAAKTPHVVVVNSSGNILYQGGVSNSRDVNRADKKYLRLALNEIQNNRSITIPEGKALGCGIPRGEKHVW